MILRTKKRQSRDISIGNIKLGGAHKIAIQTMLQESLSDVSGCIRKIRELESYGCDLVRIAIKASSEIANIKEIKKEISIPVIGDVQFNYKHALLAITEGFDGIRINPGYIADREKAAQIIDKAGEKNCVLRIGFNSGSLPKVIFEKTDNNFSREELIIKEAETLINYFEKKEIGRASCRERV